MIENGIRLAERIESCQCPGSVEVGEHFRGPDLVEAQRVFFHDDEGVGHQAGLLHGPVLDHSIDAVGRVLPVALIPDKRLPLEVTVPQDSPLTPDGDISLPHPSAGVSATKTS